MSLVVQSLKFTFFGYLEVFTAALWGTGCLVRSSIGSYSAFLQTTTHLSVPICVLHVYLTPRIVKISRKSITHSPA